MSGSPVLDTGGRLIGIHAAAEGDSIPSKEQLAKNVNSSWVIAWASRSAPLALVQQERWG